MAIKAILFDKDGTLIDFADTFFDACAQVIHKLGNGNEGQIAELANAVQFDMRTRTCSPHSQIVGGTSKSIAQLWQPITGHKTASQLALELDLFFDEYTKNTVTSFEFTRPTLEALKADGFMIGMATNDSEQNAKNHLELIKMQDLFSFVAGYDSGFGAKPEPGMIIEFANFANCNAYEIAMVGDSINDLMAGKNAGAMSIAVTSGLAGADELRPYADYTLDNIAAILKLLPIMQGTY